MDTSTIPNPNPSPDLQLPFNSVQRKRSSTLNQKKNNLHYLNPLLTQYIVQDHASHTRNPSVQPENKSSMENRSRNIVVSWNNVSISPNSTDQSKPILFLENDPSMKMNVRSRNFRSYKYYSLQNHIHCVKKLSLNDSGLKNKESAKSKNETANIKMQDNVKKLLVEKYVKNYSDDYSVSSFKLSRDKSEQNKSFFSIFPKIIHKDKQSPLLVKRILELSQSKDHYENESERKIKFQRTISPQIEAVRPKKQRRNKSTMRTEEIGVETSLNNRLSSISPSNVNSYNADIRMQYFIPPFQNLLLKNLSSKNKKKKSYHHVPHSPELSLSNCNMKINKFRYNLHAAKQNFNLENQKKQSPRLNKSKSPPNHDSTIEEEKQTLQNTENKLPKLPMPNFFQIKCYANKNNSRQINANLARCSNLVFHSKNNTFSNNENEVKEKFQSDETRKKFHHCVNIKTAVEPSLNVSSLELDSWDFQPLNCSKYEKKILDVHGLKKIIGKETPDFNLETKRKNIRKILNEDE